MINISSAAQEYFIKLLSDKKKNTQIRIFVINPGTDQAKCGICFCFPEEFKYNDVIIKFECFSVRIEQNYTVFLKDTKIDVMVVDTLETQLTIKAPNIYKNSDDNIESISGSSLEERVNYVLQHQINPYLALHGGHVSLIRVTQDFFAVIKFYGGCNGCAMANNTIKEGIEFTLKKNFPELKGVQDITQHQHGIHSYY
ncbi:NfuA family Fe-S biogenesis protein [Candidatus Blochmannia ocreatus (nom. nud.)]|uniref:Fe/S biogenesis protein NfuA n=1 Tax=Candidatus Blochmannia ocreatus (nom. nud.) TaxID=251538 RepID=A0ABY4SVF6_9ENTR|nr:NfuA family Fe-S biogenesis protein [Candidatus Blochmannia ocreatus]URJ25048.1 NfuA family Fe-S biogenesis protein [Candidatus Blochmannia ocreatus]